MNQFVKTLTNQATLIDPKFIEEVQFKGYDRNELITQIRELNLPRQTIIKLAIIGALRGNKPSDSSTIMINGQSLEVILTDLENSGSFHKRSMMGTERIGSRLTLVRLSFCLAEAVIIALKGVRSLPARFPLSKLKPYLQFMGAGSLIMPDEIRVEHEVFAREFSKAIAGEFNRSLYNKMTNNAHAPRVIKFSNYDKLH
jgi:hypothetical protein